MASNAAGSSDPSDRFILMTTTSGECALRSGARKLACCAIACVYVYIYHIYVWPRAHVITIRDRINFVLLYYCDLIIAISK